MHPQHRRDVRVQAARVCKVRSILTPGSRTGEISTVERTCQIGFPLWRDFIDTVPDILNQTGRFQQLQPLICVLPGETNPVVTDDSRWRTRAFHCEELHDPLVRLGDPFSRKAKSHTGDQLCQTHTSTGTSGKEHPKTSNEHIKSGKRLLQSAISDYGIVGATGTTRRTRRCSMGPVQNGGPRVNPRARVGFLSEQKPMQTNEPGYEKPAPTTAEPTDSNTVHYVCHDCDQLEGVSNWMAFAQAVGRAHELDTGHDVSVGRVDE